VVGVVCLIDYSIRSLRRDELEDMLVLTSTAFNSTTDAFRRIYEHDPFYDFKLTRVAEHDGRLISYLRAAPRTIWIGRSMVRMGGIAEVCTLPEYRRRGIASELLKDMVRLMSRRGFPVSMLYGRDTFYRRVGWERSSIVRWVRVPPKLLPSYEGAEDVRDFREEDLPDVMYLYDSAYAHRSCAMLRNELHWRGRVLKRTHITVYAPDRVRGYFASTTREEKTETGTRNVLLIQEAGFEDPGGLRALIADMASTHRCDLIVYEGVAGDPLLSALSVPGASITIGWSGMFRVNDVGATLDALKGNFLGFEGTLRLTVYDDVIPENTGSYLIEGSGREVTVEKGEKGGEGLDLDIRELSQMVPGTLSVWDLASQGKIGYTSKGALELADGLFPARYPLQPSIDHF